MLALYTTLPDLIPGNGTNCYQNFLSWTIGIGDGMLRYRLSGHPAALPALCPPGLHTLSRLPNAATDAPEGLERMRRSELPRG
ncbi:hypothetical protein JMJ77_0005779 [Colletotrichum scovillei]|uniref:Uncharacterized protein n=1 Tax=Colletotrichum scovillei TaxID=1209932 RepID=A0A9P7RHX1_9PEZI|nr:hypothetical protein JMJ77_0005779 [Colletotrichum scovillei]KAG7077037.1 hypothetical protein JMJ76_0014292 [Colletotrichum scovillei]KAG7084176.1 hypothetical protein JMJ78_0009615 [Colletotrichum scovillei]